MAVSLWMLPGRTTLAGNDNRNLDMVSVSIPAGAAGNWNAVFYPTDGGTKIPIGNLYTGAVTNRPSAPSGLSYAWVSPRISANITLVATTVTIIHGGRLFSTFDPAHATFRWELYKLTSSGNVETLLGTVDESAVASSETSTTASFTATMNITPIPLVAGERLVLRPFIIPAPGQTMAAVATPLEMGYGANAVPYSVKLTFTDTIVFLASNVTRLYMRRTNVNAIGNFFDLLTTKIAQAQAQGVVTTTAGGSNIQWTRTAGGTALEWISPRLTGSWRFDAPDETQVAVPNSQNTFESAATVNATLIIRMYQWRAGQETLVYEYSPTTEIATVSGTIVAYKDVTKVVVMVPTAFQPDDRIVFRAFVSNAAGTTMGAGSATFNYDAGNTSTPSAFIDLYDFPITPFKAETDPATPATVPDGINTLGLGN